MCMFCAGGAQVIIFMHLTVFQTAYNGSGYGTYVV